MKILVLGDIHDYLRPLSIIFKYAYNSDAQFVLITGDFGVKEHSLRFVSNLLSEYNWIGVSVYGNHEPKLIINNAQRGLSLGSLRILAMGEIIEHFGLSILGICGNRGSGRKWSHWRDSIIIGIINRVSGRRIDLVLSHEMPLGLADNCRGTKSCGQKVLRLLVEKLKPRLYIGGHLHTYPQYAELRNTLIVKVGGISNKGFLEGHSFFALVDIRKDRVCVLSYEYYGGRIRRLWKAAVCLT